MDCADCDDKVCREGIDCTGEGGDDTGLYANEADCRVHREAARVEAAGYGRLCRVEELLLFCDGLGIRRVGLAFCVGLSDEAKVLDQVLGCRLEVVSVCCKVCGTSKEALQLPKIRPARFEATCNPIRQAKVMEEEGTELNLIVGLCLGHDILFTRYSAAPVTTLVVKDRVLGHNPAAALYASYHRRRLLDDQGAGQEPGGGTT
jgi:uncharacterized metal-binding protein